MKTQHIPSPAEIHAAKTYLRFFESIPEYKWIKGKEVGSNDTRCALGHLKKHKIDSKPLTRLLNKFLGEGMTSINDRDGCPKINILRALKKIINYDS